MAANPPAEPSLAALPHPALRLLLATRPAFLSITLVGCLLGIAAALSDGVPFNGAAALGTVLFALLAHAGVNVLNDYYDADGSDAVNTERVFPYTGGSRFIQNGVLSRRTVARLGYALLALVVPGGLWLATLAGNGLIAIGMTGLALGWAYSAPPLQLMRRGVGELAVAGGWLLVVLGADSVQRGHVGATALAAGLPYALLVANLLFVNEFPDWRADAASGKRTLVVRLGRARARWGALLLQGIATGWLLGAVLAGPLPRIALCALAGLAPGFLGARQLLRNADTPQRLAPAIRATIAAPHLFGLLLAAALLLARFLSASA